MIMNYLSELAKHIAAITGLNEKNIVIPQKLNRQYSTPSFPYVILLENDFYSLFPEQDIIDLRNEIVVCSEFELQIISDNIDDIISLESSVNKGLSNHTVLSDISDEPSLRYADLSKSVNKKVSRSADESKKEYKSCIPLICNRIVLQKNIENPIKIELDMEIQYRIMKHLHVLNTAYNQFDKNKDVEDQIAEMYVFGDICSDTIMLPDDGFIFCYNTMIKKHCNIPEATQEYKRAKELHQKEEEARQRQREAEEKEKAEKDEFFRKLYSKVGDPEMNRYTDTIVDEIKESLGISVFGGSTFSEFLLLDYENRLPLPCILVRDDVNFSFEFKYYANNTLNNDIVTHSYSAVDYPMDYRITVIIYEKDEESLKTVRSKFLDIYSDEKSLSIPSLSFSNETLDIKLSLSNTDENIEEVECNDGTVLYYCVESFKECQAVYHTYDVNYFDIKYNQRLQLRMLQRAEFGLLYDMRLSEDAIEQFKLYEDLFKPQENNKSLYIKALDKVFNTLGSIFETAEYKEVKNCILSHSAINKNTFDKAFNKITYVYPILYDRMMQGYAPEQIKEEILSISKKYNYDWNQMLNLIAGSQCPDIARTLGLNGNENVASNKIHTALVFYISFMASKFTLLVNDANEAYKEYLAEEAEKARIEAERRAEEAEEAEERDEYNYSNPRPARHGILHNALDNAIEKSNIKNNMGKRGKRDLIGQAGCAKNTGGNCVSCNLRYACSRYL